MEPDSSSDKVTGVSFNSGTQEFGVHLPNGLEAATELAAVPDNPTIPDTVKLQETECDSISSDTLCLTATPQIPAKNCTDLSVKTESTLCLQNSHKDSAELSSGNSVTKCTVINQDSKDCANRSCVSKNVTNLENDFCTEVKTPLQLKKTKGNSSETEDEEELYAESIVETIKFKILKKYFGDTRKPGVLHRLHHKRNYGSFKCRQCYLSFHYRPSLIFHKYSHGNKHHLYECCKCSYKSSAPGAYMQHELQHHPDHLYQCEVCNIAFLQRSTWTRHVAAHVNNQSMTKEHSSSHLGDKTATQSKMTCNIPDQLEVIHGMASQNTKTPKPSSSTKQQCETRNEQIKCKFCQQLFPLEGEEYTQHLQSTDKSVTSAKKSCPWCSFIGSSTCHLTRHKHKIHLCCLLCNKKYPHKDLLRQHVNSFHSRLVNSPGKIKARRRPKAFGKKHKPGLCLTSETSRQQMEDHQEHKSLPNNKEVVQHWYCMTCKVIFPTKRLLDLHIKLNHRPMKKATEGHQEQENDEMGQWRCLLCNTLHETLRECDKHLLRIHPDEYEYCPRDEIAEPTLSVDLPVLPESEPPYTCNMCDSMVTSSELLHKHKEKFHKVAYKISITEELNAKQRSYRCRYRCGYTDCLYMNVTKHEVNCAQKVPVTSIILPSAVLDTSTGKLITKYSDVLKPDTDSHQSLGHPITEQQASLTGTLSISQTLAVSVQGDQNAARNQASVMSNLNMDEMQSASFKYDQSVVGMELPPKPSRKNLNSKEQPSQSNMQTFNDKHQLPENCMQNENKTQQTSDSSMQNENKTLQTSDSSMQNENETLQTSDSSMQNENKTLQTSDSSMQNENETLQTSNGSMQNENKTLQTSHSSMQNVNMTGEASNCRMQNVNETRQTSTTCNSVENENKMLKSSPTSVHKFKGQTQCEKEAVIKTTAIDRVHVIKTFNGKELQDVSKSPPNSQPQPVQSTIPTDQRWNLTSSNAAKITAHKNPTIIVMPRGSGKKTTSLTNTVCPRKDKVIVYRRLDETSSSSDEDSDCSWLDKSSCSSEENEDENGDLSPVFPSSDEEVAESVPNQGAIQSANRLVNPGTSSTRNITSCPPLLQPTVLMRFFQAIDMSDLYRLALQMITGSPQPHTLPTSDPLMDAFKTTSFKYKIPMGYSHKEFHDMPLFPSSPEVMRIDYMQTLPSKLVSKHYKTVVAKPQVLLLTSLVDSAVLDHVKGTVLKGVERFVRKQRVEDRKDITLSLSQYIVSQYFKNQEKKDSSQNPLNFSLATGSGNSPGAGPSCVKTKPSITKTPVFKSTSNRPSPSSTQRVQVNKPAVYGVTKTLINVPPKQSNIQHSSQQTEMKKSSDLKKKTNVACSRLPCTNREQETTIANKSQNVQGKAPEVGKSEKKDNKSVKKATAIRETENRKDVASLKVHKSPTKSKPVRNESVPLRRSSRLLRTSDQQCDKNSEASAVTACDGQKHARKRTKSNEQKDHKGQEKKRKMSKQTCSNEIEIESKNDKESCQKDNQGDSKPPTVLKAKTRCNESLQPGRNSSNSDQSPPESSSSSSQITSLIKGVTASGDFQRAQTSSLNHAVHEYSSYDAHHDEHNAMLHVAPETILPEIYLDTKVQHTGTETNIVERNGILQMTRHPLYGLNRGTMQIHTGANAELHPLNCKTYLKHIGHMNSPAKSKLMESVATQNDVKTRGVKPRIDPSLQLDDTPVKKPLICKWNERIENSFKPLLYKKPQTCISHPENQHGLRNWAGHTWKQTVSKAEVLELMTKRKTWKCAPYKMAQESRTARENNNELINKRIAVGKDTTVSSEEAMKHNILDAGESTVSQIASHQDSSLNGTHSNISEDGKECGQCTNGEMSEESSTEERMECEVVPSNAELETATGERGRLDTKPLDAELETATGERGRLDTKPLDAELETATGERGRLDTKPLDAELETATGERGRLDTKPLDAELETATGERGRLDTKPLDAELETATGERGRLDSKPLEGSRNMIHSTGSINRCQGTAEHEDSGVQKQIIRRRSLRNLQLKRKVAANPKDKQHCTVDHSYIKFPKLKCRRKSTCTKSKIGYQLRNRCGIGAGLVNIGVGSKTSEKRLKVPHDHCYISTKKPKTTAMGTDKTDHCYYWKTQSAQKTTHEDDRACKQKDASLTQCDKGPTQKPTTQHPDRICKPTHSQAQDHSYSLKNEQEQKASMDHCYVRITALVCMDGIQTSSSATNEPDAVQHVTGRSRGVPEVGSPNTCNEMLDRRILRPRRKGYQQ
ncbi:uncharacterized protein LOC117301719 isoform X2 [Asterias rubens]|uniref:uncharacterized protein LOC117301719 isoform X2 n=1 Tax=Asterias rubens TaxID=7604 RepID=UPI00145564F3|nr:uncharacterized protein LOC117301719 isoform X2 [Asterias rubens]